MIFGVTIKKAENGIEIKMRSVFFNTNEDPIIL